MQLRSLRPKEGADLRQLRALMEGRGWKAALPASLPDALLLRLARDFRHVELNLTAPCDDDEELPAMEPALYVTMNLLLQHPARPVPSGELPLSDKGMIHALQMYQWGLEREIIGRLVGAPIASHADAMLEGLWRSMHA